MPPVKSLYSVTGSIGTDDMTAHVILDKKNNSIHIHFYIKMFGNERKPILVKHANVKFPEGDDAAMIENIILRELPNKKVDIKKIAVMKEKEEGSEPTQHPHRIIIRFKK